MTTSAVPAQESPALTPSPTPPQPPNFRLVVPLNPAQFVTLTGLSKRYGMSKSLIVHMLIDLEDETNRLPSVIVKRLRSHLSPHSNN